MLSMAKPDISSDQRIIDKAEAIARTVISQQSFYNSQDCNKNHRQLLETMVGAAIWYLPTPPELYSGNTSSAALEKLQKADDPSVVKITKEHLYPRKVAARELFQLDWSCFSRPYMKMQQLYLEKYGRFNYVLPEENKRLVKHQKAENFVSPQHSYEQAGVKLLKVSNALLKAIRKGDQQLAALALSGGVD